MAWTSYSLDQVAQQLVLDARLRDRKSLNQSFKMRESVAYGLERFWGEHLRLQVREPDKSQYWKATWDALVDVMRQSGITVPNDTVHVNNTTDEPTYEVAGKLQWLLRRSLPESQQNILLTLMRLLMRFAMLLGGFGKSWRRADHRLFNKEYYEQNETKPLIRCHWQWDKSSLINENKVRKLDHVAPFLNHIRTTASDWIKICGITPTPDSPTDWREAWHPDNVQVWGRFSQGREDCKAVQWLHKPYQKFDRYLRQQTQTIKQTSVTGSINQIGRLWHRMYPVVRVNTTMENGKQKRRAIPTKNFMELLTMFPDDSQECTNFLNFLHEE
ncbi:hypothetical protein [Phormidium sp. CCY1219]|uniref:hypothetical protein n=1 Tax=Phormidium sp. CCY1219 TaxID=2886104 RepID=UPI002D7889DF|nr:hypothetical protein [Phormidium sp. CCY1219]